MIAKLIAHGENRADACRKLASAVQDSVLLGVNNNKLFLRNVLRHPVFLAGEATTAFIEQHFQHDPSLHEKQVQPETLALAALLHFCWPPAERQGWHNPAAASYHYKLDHQGTLHDVRLQQLEQSFRATVDEASFRLDLLQISAGSCVVLVDGVRRRLCFCKRGETLYLDDGSGHFQLENITHAPAAAIAGAGSGEVKASMDGAIVSVLVKTGDVVAAGQTLLILEAMKMEHPLQAGISGIVKAVNADVGEQVKSRQLLAVVAAAEEV